jgi:hypothetical protein
MGAQTRQLVFRLSFIVASLAIGCAPAFIPLDKEEMARLKNEPQILVVIYEPSRFAYQNPARPVAPGAAGVFNPATGAPLIGMPVDPYAPVFLLASALDDPVGAVKDVFVLGLAGRLGATRLVDLQEVLADDGIQGLQKRFGSGVVLDFRTRSWGLLQGATRLFPYQIVYEVRSRLLRLRDGRILWQGHCQYDGRYARANLDEVAANSVPLLKEKFRDAAGTCGKTLLEQFFDRQRSDR